LVTFGYRFRVGFENLGVGNESTEYVRGRPVVVDMQQLRGQELLLLGNRHGVIELRVTGYCTTESLATDTGNVRRCDQGTARWLPADGLGRR
jgi:hypothetical protein